MVERGEFLRVPYGAYLHRDIPQEDTELTHVGPGTPCGEYMRRFWQPMAFTRDLKDLPVRTRLLGEDLVLFRDRSSRVGLLQLHCAHRGTSLEFGQIAERGIKCCYHGWHFDVDGRILETPGEPSDSTLKDRLFHGAYPAIDYKGIIFAYMGPPDKKPLLRELDTFDIPGFRMVEGRAHVMPCNWLQVKENVMDTAHNAFLHTIASGVQFTESFREMGVLDWMETPNGMISMQTRRIGDNVWVRINDFIPPNIRQFAPSFETGEKEKQFNRCLHTLWSVPIDDTHTLNINFFREREGTTDEQRKAIAAHYVKIGEGGGQTDERPYENRQRVPGDYDAQVSQRPIAVHGLEHLASTDRGVIMVRRIVRDGIRAVARGEDPKGLGRQSKMPLLTYSSDTVLRIPPSPTPEDDRRLLLKTGRMIADEFLRNHPTFGAQHA